MKKIILICILIFNFSLHWQGGSINIGTLTEIKAWGDEGGDDWGDDDWWDDDDIDWEIDLEEIIVYPDDDYDPDDGEELFFPDDDDDDWWWYDDDWDDDWDDGGSSGDDSHYGDPTGFFDLCVEELMSLYWSWSVKDWSNPQQIYTVDIDGDDVIDGYIFKDASGNIHFQSTDLDEVIVIGKGRVEPTETTPLNLDEDNDKDDEDVDWSGQGGGDPEPKEPKERKDCDESGADRRANNAKIVTNQTKENYAKLKAKTGEKNEFSASIDYKGNNKFEMSGLREGSETNAPISGNSTTMYLLHTHTSNEPPSMDDFYGFSNFLNALNKQGPSYNIQGAIVICPDDEYLISITNRQEALDFYHNNPDFFKDNGTTLFNNKDAEDLFTDIEKSLYDKGYTDENMRHVYSYAHILSHYKTGLSISLKTKDDDQFKEFATTKDNDKEKSYTPTKCP